MTMIKTHAAKVMAMFALLGLMITPANAQKLNSADLAFSFGSKEIATADFRKTAKTGKLASVRDMSQTEMKETEGAVAPLVAVGVMTASRFIVQRYVTQRVATNIVSNGGSVMAASRQQAAAIARNASNGNRGIREFHSGSGERFTHYHTNPRNGSHVWYGKSR